jgi:hypothetical protein
LKKIQVAVHFEGNAPCTHSLIARKMLWNAPDVEKDNKFFSVDGIAQCLYSVG